jgi:hypothetical protein
MVNLDGQPLSQDLALHVEERENKGGSIQLLFPIAKPHDSLERGVEAGKKEHRTDTGIGHAFLVSKHI